MVIAELKGKGKDTRPLEEALATFRGRIAGLEVDNTAVMTRLTVNSGFDATGKVINKGIAEQTVRDAKEMLGTISDYGDGAYVALHKAINDYYDHVAPYEFREPPRP
jgi:hypothetical protein